MDYTLRTQHEIKIKSTPQVIWKYLTTEDYISIYIKGIDVSFPSCEVGSVILYSWKENGKIMIDKAYIQESVENELLSYHYFKHNSENYTKVTFKISNDTIGFSFLSVEGKGFMNGVELDHASETWSVFLEKIKNSIESTTFK